MDETQLALSVSDATVASDAGSARISMGPVLQGERWDGPLTVNVGNDGTVTPQVRVYLGVEAVANYLQGSNHGKQDGAQLDVTLRMGDVLTFVWSGASPGSNCYASVMGARVLRGKVAY